MKRPLETYSAAVLAEWIRVRGWSWFPEELDAIERRVERRMRRVAAPLPKPWITALVLNMTDEELVQLADGIKGEMNERVICADSGDADAG